MVPESTLSKIPYFINIFDIICISATVSLGLVYDNKCYKSTDKENHKNIFRYRNSYIIKRFIFELLNRFIALGYIAFVLSNCKLIFK